MSWKKYFFDPLRFVSLIGVLFGVSVMIFHKSSYDTVIGFMTGFGLAWLMAPFVDTPQIQNKE
jgi:hypothetical protein